MLEVVVNLDVNEANAQESPWLDDAQLGIMLDQTREQVSRHVRAKLQKVPLEAPLKVVVTGSYSLETEQMELSYHIDTDDKQLLFQVVTALNR